MVQWPDTHCSPELHATPQSPQLFTSLANAVQNAAAPVPHKFGFPSGHSQLLPTHDWPCGHTLPHAPQLLSSVPSFEQYVGVAGASGHCV